MARTPLQVLGEVVEVYLATRTRALALDGQGRVRYAEKGEERPAPCRVELPGLTLRAVDPLVHRSLSADEAKHTRASAKRVAAVFKAHGPVADRAMFWKGGKGYHDYARLGPVVVWRCGMNNAFNETVRVLTFTSVEAADLFLADLRGKPPKGYRATSPFYVPGRGAVIRTFGKAQQRELLGVVDAELRRYGGRLVKRYPSPAKAEAAFEKWVHAHLGQGWGEYGIELDKRNRSAAEQA